MDFSKYLNKALDLEEAGYVTEALLLMDKLITAFPQDQEALHLELAKMKYRNGNEKDALLDFIALYENAHAEEIYELVLEAYYIPKRKKLEALYQDNKKLLENYPLYRNFNHDSNVTVIPIWQDEAMIICVNLETKQFATAIYERNTYEFAPDTVVMIVNELWMDMLLDCEIHSRISTPFLDEQLPMYAAFDQIYWELFIQLYDLHELTEKERIVFLVGRETLTQYLKEKMVFVPKEIYASQNDEKKDYETIIEDVETSLYEIWEENGESIKAYYEKNYGQINQNIKTKKPRILFCTSRFTTVLQYHTRDCMAAAKRLGCETELLIETDGLHRVFARDFLSCIAHFQPDIIFALDDFRFRYSFIPKEVVWIAWVQDMTNDIMAPMTPLKLTDRDFVMNHFTTWGKFQEVGYSERALINAPIPANSWIYNPYELSHEERKSYTCDVCFVCHASDAEQHIQEMISCLPQNLHKAVRTIYENYQGYVYETGELFYDEELFAAYINESMQVQFGYKITDNALQYLSHDMYQWFNQRVFRQALVDWLLDAGITNIKLWGNGWKNSPKYEKYAMGPAQNGETLSKIYQAAKIVVGNNVQTTSAARAWETMLSGGFYMSNYIPPEFDITDIRKIIEVDSDVVMFYNKEDFIQKIHYYLEHEEERQEMIRRGRKAALEKMTFDKLMEHTLDEVANRLEA